MKKVYGSHPYQICVSGAAKGTTVAVADVLAERAGRRIAETGNTLLTGATHGLPDCAAKGAKSAGGVSIGFSPASNRRQHVKTYQAPTKYYDCILYTGFDYTGRDLLLARSADALVIVGGRIGTLHEFTVAFEEKTPIGVITGSGGVSDAIKDVLQAAKRVRHTVLYDDDPARLVDRLLAILNEKYRAS